MMIHAAIHADSPEAKTLAPATSGASAHTRDAMIARDIASMVRRAEELRAAARDESDRHRRRLLELQVGEIESSVRSLRQRITRGR